MEDIRSNIIKLIGDYQDIEKLLILEKKKRKLNRETLVFLGMANIAEYYWCAMKSYFKSKEMEWKIFNAYLFDRVLYAYELGYIDKLPENKEKLLETGDEITFDDIEKLLEKRAKKGKSIILFVSEKRIDENGNEVMVINTDIPKDDIERIHAEMEAKSKGIRIAGLEEFPKIRGKFLESTKAKKYPKIRWHFNWNGYVIVGVPDGIDENIVYEFKTTRSKFLMFFIKPVATTQADLYGYFFGRKNKIVEIYTVNENEMKNWQSEVDQKRAEEVLNEFKMLDKGNEPLPPKPWKCKQCEYRISCRII